MISNTADQIDYLNELSMQYSNCDECAPRYISENDLRQLIKAANERGDRQEAIRLDRLLSRSDIAE